MLWIPVIFIKASISTNGCVSRASAIALLVISQTFISTVTEILTENLGLALHSWTELKSVVFLKIIYFIKFIMLWIPASFIKALISTNGCVFWASAIALLINAKTFTSTGIVRLTKNVEKNMFYIISRQVSLHGVEK